MSDRIRRFAPPDGLSTHNATAWRMTEWEEAHDDHGSSWKATSNRARYEIGSPDDMQRLLTDAAAVCDDHLVLLWLRMEWRDAVHTHADDQRLQAVARAMQIVSEAVGDE